MFQLTLLGTAALRDAHGAPLALSSRRHPLALLAVLAMAPGHGLGRGKLTSLLWPDCAEGTARNRLSTCVHQVRSALGEGVLRTSGDDVHLDAAALDCDLLRFEAALQAGDAGAAEACYGGPLLDGFTLPRSPGFDQHVAIARERLAQSWLDLLERQAEQAQHDGNPGLAVGWWRQRARADPCDGRVARRLMEALEFAGNRAEALRVARAHAQALHDELGAAPDAGLTALAGRLQQANAPAAMPFPAWPPAGNDATRGAAQTLAVLPFETLGVGDDAETFAAGLHGDLLTELARLPGLRVIARTSMLRFRGTELPVQAIGAELGAGILIEGTVQQHGQRLRLNLRLVDVHAAAQRWAERFECELSASSLFEVQASLVRGIAAQLSTELLPAAWSARSGRAPPASLDAYRLHALGRQRLEQLTATSLREAVAFFRRALEADPDYPLAWVGLADALGALADYGYAADPAAQAAEAESAAQRALALAPDLAEAHASLGALYTMLRRGPDAVGALARAVRLHPGYAQAHDWQSWTAQCTGDARQALTSARRAVELDPLLPEAVSNLAASLLATGDPHAALHTARTLREIAPGWPTNRFYEALALHRLGQAAAMLPLLDGLDLAWAGNGARCALALAHAACGDRAAATVLLHAFVRDGDRFSAGLVHAAMGDPDAAMAAFAGGIAWGQYWPTLAVHHYFPTLLTPLPAYPRMRAAVLHAWGMDERIGAQAAVPA